MKTIISIISITLCFSFMSEIPVITLQEALNKKITEVNIFSLGSYQGESVVMEVKNLSAKPWRINVEPGRVLKAPDDKYQNLLIVQGKQFILKPNSSASNRLQAFCCESTDAGPSQNLNYKTNHLADSSLVKLASFINTNKSSLSHTSIQQAIWAISNKHATAAINISNEKEMSLKYLVAQLKNESVPWYIIKQKVYQLPNGRIHLVNDTLEGKMAYTSSGWTYSKLNIYNKNDNGVLISIGSWLKPGINSTYPVCIDVKKLPKGKYKLSLEDEKQIFTQKDIEI
jgi:hypothetical protein